MSTFISCALCDWIRFLWRYDEKRRHCSFPKGKSHKDVSALDQKRGGWGGVEVQPKEYREKRKRTKKRVQGDQNVDRMKNK